MVQVVGGVVVDAALTFFFCYRSCLRRAAFIDLTFEIFMLFPSYWLLFYESCFANFGNPVQCAFICRNITYIFFGGLRSAFSLPWHFIIITYDCWCRRRAKDMYYFSPSFSSHADFNTLDLTLLIGNRTKEVSTTFCEEDEALLK